MWLPGKKNSASGSSDNGDFNWNVNVITKPLSRKFRVKLQQLIAIAQQPSDQQLKLLADKIKKDQAAFTDQEAIARARTQFENFVLMAKKYDRLLQDSQERRKAWFSLTSNHPEYDSRQKAYEEAIMAKNNAELIIKDLVRVLVKTELQIEPEQLTQISDIVPSALPAPSFVAPVQTPSDTPVATAPQPTSLTNPITDPYTPTTSVPQPTASPNTNPGSSVAIPAAASSSITMMPEELVKRIKPGQPLEAQLDSITQNLPGNTTINYQKLLEAAFRHFVDNFESTAKAIVEAPLGTFMTDQVQIAQEQLNAIYELKNSRVNADTPEGYTKFIKATRFWRPN